MRGRARGRQGANKAPGDPARPPGQAGGAVQPGQPQLGAGRQPGGPQPQPGAAAWPRGGPAAQVPPMEGPGAGAKPPTGVAAGAGPVAVPPGSGRASHRGASSALVGGTRRPLEEDMQRLSLRGGGFREGEGVEKEYMSGLSRRKTESSGVTRGTMGTPMRCRGNYFKMTYQPQFHIFQYHVDFQPPVENKKMKKTLLYNHKELLGEVCAFDGMILYCTRKLPEEKTVLHSLRLKQDVNVQITIKFTCEVAANSPMIIPIMNIIWRKILGVMGMKQIQRHFFNMDQAIEVRKHGLQVIPGFQTSILRYEGGVMLEIDLAHKILRTKTVLDLIMEQRLPGDQLLVWMRKNIVGSIVMTTYNNKTYRVDDIDENARVTDTFQWRNTERTYKDYYETIHNIQIRNDRQPLLVHTCNAREKRSGLPELIHLIPELCLVTGLSDEARSDFRLMSDVAVHTRISPGARVDRLRRFMSAVKQNEAIRKELEGWQMGFDDDLVQMDVRQAPPEKIVMFEPPGRPAEEVQYSQNQPDWSKGMRNKRLRLPIPLRNWAILFPRQNMQDASNLCNTLRNVGPPMGMDIGEPDVYELPNDRNDSYLMTLREAINEKVQMVVCVLPNNKKDRYDAIKKMCCIDKPVPSQMVLSRTLGKQKSLMSVATKIAIQMNCKMGGIIWGVQVPLKKVMMVGIDTYHDSSQKGRSCAALVATTNDDWTRYHCNTSFQMTHEELHNHLNVAMTASLRAYANKNGYLPEKIIVFRDGVGDGQLDTVSRFEVEQIRNAMKQAGQDYQGKLSFIVVKKRINARFFSGGARDEANNPPPGTLIDHTVTRDYWFDFFLIPQSVREGTVGPTHYNILHEDEGMNMRPDYYQRIAYKLTHMYWNWQGTVRVPAPCMYAHKLAFLSGQSLHRDFSHHLADKLFFL